MSLSTYYLEYARHVASLSVDSRKYVCVRTILRDSTVVVRTRPRAIPLPMITMRKSIHGFLFPYMVMGLRLAVLRATGAPLKKRQPKFQ